MLPALSTRAWHKEGSHQIVAERMNEMGNHFLAVGKGGSPVDPHIISSPWMMEGASQISLDASDELSSMLGIKSGHKMF